MSVARFSQHLLRGLLLVLLLTACGESVSNTSVATQGGEMAMNTIMPTSDGQANTTSKPTLASQVTSMPNQATQAADDQGTPSMQAADGQATPCPATATIPPEENSTTATVQSATNVPATTTLGALTTVPLGTTVPNDPCIQVPSDAPTQSSPTP